MSAAPQKERSGSSFFSSLQNFARKTRLLAEEPDDFGTEPTAPSVAGVIASKTAASTPAVDSKTLETLFGYVQEGAPLAVQYFDAVEALEDISDESKRIRNALKVLKRAGTPDDVRKAISTALRVLDSKNDEFKSALKEERRTKLTTKQDQLASATRALEAEHSKITALEKQVQDAQATVDTETTRLSNVESGWNAAQEMLRDRFQDGLKKISAL